MGSSAGETATVGLCCLTFDMSGGGQTAKLAGRRPLDGVVRFHRGTMPQMLHRAQAKQRPRVTGAPDEAPTAAQR